MGSEGLQLNKSWWSGRKLLLGWILPQLIKDFALIECHGMKCAVDMTDYRMDGHTLVTASSFRIQSCLEVVDIISVLSANHHLFDSSSKSYVGLHDPTLCIGLRDNRNPTSAGRINILRFSVAATATTRNIVLRRELLMDRTPYNERCRATNYGELFPSDPDRSQMAMLLLRLPKTSLLLSCPHVSGVRRTSW